jgi:4-carboxymuconolactone decarboxylase
MPYANKSSNLVPRYNGPSEQEMTEEQAEIRRSILASRPGTGLHGPFGPWLAIPSIARPAQQLGEACRYGTSLTKRESELVILLTGAKYQSSTEFDIHVGEALKAGWTMDLIEAIPRTDFSLANVKTNVLPILLQDNTTTSSSSSSTTSSSSSSRERAIAIFAAELLATNTVSDETYQSTREALEEQDSVLVEITSIVGYYAHVCLTLNVFQIPSF